MSEEKPKKIFLSYAHEDINTALNIYSDLKRYGLDIWIDIYDLKPGQRWKDQIEDTIEESAYFIFLLSSQSLNKRGFVQRELNYALEILKEVPAGHEYIIPVRLDNCEPKNRILREIQWIDLFPESEYQNGLKKILQVVSPGTFFLRSKSKKLSNTNVTNIILKFNFFDNEINSEGKGIKHNYRLQEINGNKVIFDEATGLMWQQSGSSNEMLFEDAKEWIRKLNVNGFAGFKDWRLPTLEEAMSLMEPEKKQYIYSDPIFGSTKYCILTYSNPIFDSTKCRIWTADQTKGKLLAWIVDFYNGKCYDVRLDINNYVRVIRLGQSLID